MHNCCNLDCALGAAEKTDPECIRRSDNLLLNMRVERMIHDMEALIARVDHEIKRLPRGAVQDVMCDVAVLLSQANGHMLHAYMETKR